MAKIALIDLADHFYDRHSIYSLLSVLIANGHEVSYIPNLKYNEILKRMKEIRPNLVLYSTFTCDIPLYKRLDYLLKKEMSFTSLVGGHGPTYDPEHILETTIDALCMGEGEPAIIEFIESGFKGNNNVFLTKEFQPGGCTSGFNSFIDLDDLPLPNRDLVYEQDPILRDMPSKQFVAGRGCPYLCTYCHNHAYNEMFKESGAIIRFKSVDYLIEEIKQVKAKYPLKTIVFQDDVFILKRDWLREFCERFPKEVGIPFTCNVKAEIVAREEIVEMLKEGGCCHAAWSIESGNDHFRNKILKRNMSKKQILKAADNLNKYEIPHRVGNIIGMPGETYKNMLETIELNILAKPKLAIGSIFTPYPGLELTDYAVNNNFLDPEDLRNLPDTMYEHSMLKFTLEEKDNIQRIAYLFPWLVEFPFLYYKKLFFEGILMKLPPVILRPFYHLFYSAKMGNIFKVKTSLKIKIGILRKYFFRSKTILSETAEV